MVKNDDVTIVNWYSPSSLNRLGRGELNHKVEIVDIIKPSATNGLG